LTARSTSSAEDQLDDGSPSRRLAALAGSAARHDDQRDSAHHAETHDPAVHEGGPVGARSRRAEDEDKAMMGTGLSANRSQPTIRFTMQPDKAVCRRHTADTLLMSSDLHDPAPGVRW
jgi:hypothetical protein